MQQNTSAVSFWLEGLEERRAVIVNAASHLLLRSPRRLVLFAAIVVTASSAAPKASACSEPPTRAGWLQREGLPLVGGERTEVSRCGLVWLQAWILTDELPDPLELTSGNTIVEAPLVRTARHLSAWRIPDDAPAGVFSNSWSDLLVTIRDDDVCDLDVEVTLEVPEVSAAYVYRGGAICGVPNPAALNRSDAAIAFAFSSNGPAGSVLRVDAWLEGEDPDGNVVRRHPIETADVSQFDAVDGEFRLFLTEHGRWTVEAQLVDETTGSVSDLQSAEVTLPHGCSCVASTRSPAVSWVSGFLGLAALLFRRRRK